MLTIPNNSGIYSTENYTHHPIITVTGKRFFRLKLELSAELLMIKWWPIGRIAAVNQFEGINGLIRISAVAGVGNLPPVDFNHRIDRAKTAQFIAPGFNGLSYTIDLQQRLQSTQIQISEYSQPISFLDNDQQMSINYPPSTEGSNGSTEATTSVNASLTAVQLLPANNLRAPGGIIVNNSNRRLFVSFSATVPPTTTGNFQFVPQNGGSLDLPAGYEGEIWGIWAGPTPTLGAAISHFTYIT